MFAFTCKIFSLQNFLAPDYGFFFFFYTQGIPFNFPYKADLVVMDSFNFSWSGKLSLSFNSES